MERSAAADSDEVGSAVKRQRHTSGWEAIGGGGYGSRSKVGGRWAGWQGWQQVSVDCRVRSRGPALLVIFSGALAELLVTAVAESGATLLGSNVPGLAMHPDGLSGLLLVSLPKHLVSVSIVASGDGQQWYMVVEARRRISSYSTGVAPVEWTRNHRQLR